jgi:hypothetical protein
MACDTAPHQAAPADSSVSAIMNPQACDAPALKPANHRRFLIRPESSAAQIANGLPEQAESSIL